MIDNQTTNVASFLLDGKDPTRTAIRLPQTSYSYGALQQASFDVARRLLEMGAKKGRSSCCRQR